MNKLLISGLLQIPKEEIGRWKIRMNKHDNGKTAFENYLNNNDSGEFDRMTMWCEKHSMFQKGEIIIGLAKIDYESFLLVKIYEIKEEDESKYHSDERYKYVIRTDYDYLFGRVVLRIKNGYDKSYPVQQLAKIELTEGFEVLEIKPSAIEDNGFKGYDNVKLSYSELKRIVERRPEDWINALSNQQAVYLITDLKTGKLYVGSATSKDKMLLSRWTDYVNNGHGGNKEFRKIVNNSRKGIKYIKDYFQYSILENYNSKADPSYIIKREQYWKKVLDSINHGMNDN